MFSDQFRRGESEKGKLTGVKGSKLLSNLSDVAWKAFQSVNTRLPEGEAITSEVGPGPAAEILRTHLAAARLPTRDRQPLSALRQGSSRRRHQRRDYSRIVDE